MSFRVADRVQIIDFRRSAFTWEPRFLMYIGCRGVVQGPLVNGMHSVLLDSGESLYARPEVLRLLGPKDREDLRLVSWSQCPWHPKATA